MGSSTRRWRAPSRPMNPLNDSSIRNAVALWASNRTAAESAYGPMARWDVSEVVDMVKLFARPKDCDELCVRHVDVCKRNNTLNRDEELCRRNMELCRGELGHSTNDESCKRSLADFNEDISGWDTRSVGQIRGMFWGASSFTVDISSWNTSNIWNMRRAFFEASSFDRDLTDWDVEQVVYFDAMFLGAKSFSRRLCWDVAGKQTLRMFTDTNGGAVDLTCQREMLPNKQIVNMGMTLVEDNRPGGDNVGEMREKNLTRKMILDAGAVVDNVSPEMLPKENASRVVEPSLDNVVGGTGRTLDGGIDVTSVISNPGGRALAAGGVVVAVLFALFLRRSEKKRKRG